MTAAAPTGRDVPATSRPVPLRADLRGALEVVRTVAHLDVAAVARELYARWYVVPQPDPPPAPAESPAVLLRLNLPGALRAADTASQRWQDGWKVEAISSRGRILATAGDDRRVFDRVDVLPTERPCLPPRVGDPVQVTVRRDHLSSDGGTWFTMSGGWDQDRAPEVRVYWNVPLDHAPALVHHLTRGLHDDEVDYGLKLPAVAEGYARADTAVLYLAGRPDAATRAVRHTYRCMAGRLRDQTPALTLRLAPGLALSEDPGTGESFGEHRCRLLAHAALPAVRDGHPTLTAAVEMLLDGLVRAGIDPQRPYARPDSDLDYQRFVVDDT